MGCGNTKNAMQAISEEVQPISTGSLAQPKANLPPEVMLGFDKVLKTANATPQGPHSERVLPETKGEALLSPGDQGKTGNDITPMDAAQTSGEKHLIGVETATGQPTDLPLIQEEQRLAKVKTLVDTDPEEKPVPVAVAAPVLPQISEEPEAMLNAYMEQPVTNPYLELMRTQEQGKVPLPEAELEPMGPPLTPKAAFMEDQSIPATS